MNRSVETALNSPRAELCLRPYRLEDGDRIVTWCAGEGDFYKWSAGKLGAYPLTPARFNQSVAARENGYFPFVLDEDGKAVGFFILRQPGEDTDVLRFGFVILDPSFRGKGYGKKMLAFGIRHAFQDCGAKKVTLGVFANNPGAYHCYKSLGFRETGIASAYQIGNETWDCLELELPLWQKRTVRRPQAVPTIPRPETV